MSGRINFTSNFNVGGNIYYNEANKTLIKKIIEFARLTSLNSDFSS